MDVGWMRPIGRALRGLRAGMHGIASQRSWLAGVPECIAVSSPVFGHGEDMPSRFTAYGEGLSPPLAWHGVPDGTAELVLLVEDPDVPLPIPLVHAVVVGMPPSLGSLADGALARADGTAGIRVGRNSIGSHAWLPPSPPPGHGPHHYAFQLFALDRPLRFEWPPGRHALLQAIRGRVIGRGVLFGIFERA